MYYRHSGPPGQGERSPSSGLTPLHKAIAQLKSSKEHHATAGSTQCSQLLHVVTATAELLHAVHCARGWRQGEPRGAARPGWGGVVTYSPWVRVPPAACRLPTERPLAAAASTPGTGDEGQSRFYEEPSEGGAPWTGSLPWAAPAPLAALELRPPAATCGAHCASFAAYTRAVSASSSRHSRN